MLLWLSWQSASLVRTRSPVQIRLTAPKNKSKSEDLLLFFVFVSVRTVYHHALACIKNTFAMMIYKTSFWWYAIPTELMIYTPAAWFCVWVRILNTIHKNIFFVAFIQKLVVFSYIRLTASYMHLRCVIFASQVICLRALGANITNYDHTSGYGLWLDSVVLYDKYLNMY